MSAAFGKSHSLSVKTLCGETVTLRNAADHRTGGVRMNDWIQREEGASVEEETRPCPSVQACVGRQLR